MPNPYAAVFGAPGAKGFAAAAFIGRMPIAMAPIGIVAMHSQTHGEYWLAGAVAATFGLTNAFVAPQISRLVDRLGQTVVAAPAAAISALAFLALLAATNQRWAVWTLFLFAFLAAPMPSMPAMVRARWSELFRDRPELNTAFAYESAAEELIYIAGASLSVGLSVALFPEAGMLASTIFLIVGMTAFLLQRSTEPSIQPASFGQSGSALRLVPVQLVTLALIFIGAIFAATEVSVIAVTKELGQPGAASLVIGVYAAGSFVVGLVMGAINRTMPLQRQLAIATAVVAGTGLLPLLGHTVPTLALTVFLSGLAISPVFITAFGLIERRAPASMLTEGITWAVVGIGIGMALGAFVAGWVVDVYGARSGFYVGIAAGAAALSTVLLAQGALARERSATLPLPVDQPAE